MNDTQKIGLNGNKSYARSLAILVVGLAGGHLTTDTRF